MQTGIGTIAPQIIGPGSLQPQTQHREDPSSSTSQRKEAQQGSGAMNFQVLYTKHKTQKRKVWQDGRLSVRGCVLGLHSADPPAGSGDPTLDTLSLQPDAIQALREGRLSNLASEKFLLQIEGPWRGSTMISVPAATAFRSGGRSDCMKKLLQKKFRKPASIRPPPPPGPKSLPFQQKRPLQPGDLYRQYYGTLNANAEYAVASSHSEMPQRSQHHQGLPLPHRAEPPTLRQPVLPKERQLTQLHLENNAPSLPSSNADNLQHRANSYHTINLGTSLEHKSTPGPAQVSEKTGPSRTFHSNTLTTHANDALDSRPRKLFKQSSFVANAFDPSGFYGVEGEEDEEERAPAEVDSGQEHQSSGHSHQEHQSNPANKSMKRQSGEEQESNTVCAVSQGDPLTTDDLWKLFGGSEEGEEVSINHGVESNEREGTVASHLRERSENQFESATAKTIVDPFLLPPASHSSDDEADDD